MVKLTRQSIFFSMGSQQEIPRLLRSTELRIRIVCILNISRATWFRQSSSVCTEPSLASASLATASRAFLIRPMTTVRCWTYTALPFITLVLSQTIELWRWFITHWHNLRLLYFSHLLKFSKHFNTPHFGSRLCFRLWIKTHLTCWNP